MEGIIGKSLQTNNTKPFWNFIKAAKREVFGVPSLSVDSSMVTSPMDKANLLNQQFSSVFTDENLDSIPVTEGPNLPDMPSITILPEGVLKLLRNLNPSKATGPDAIPAKILKECAESLAPVLAKIFQKSLDVGRVPTSWLDANITPIYKKGDRSKASNYRPVSLTSIPCKLLEHIIHHHIMSHFDQHNVLSDVQHGFRRGRSCETQLSALVYDLARALDREKQVDLVIMEFSNASAVYHISIS